MNLFYNPIRASWKTLNPRDKKILKQESKFKRSIFLYNVNRLKLILMDIYFLINFINSCFKWDCYIRSLTALIFFIIFTYYFEPYMLPLFGLGIFLKNYLKFYLSDQSKDNQTDSTDQDSLLDENEDDEDDKVFIYLLIYLFLIKLIN